MPKTHTVTSYSLDELKESHPQGYANALERWQEGCRASGDISWSEETMGSLKATIAECSFKLRDWSIGPYAYSSLSVSDERGIDEDDEGKPEVSDLDWFCEAVLDANGYTRSDTAKDRNGNPIPNGYKFPGKCPFTGYCFDEACLESVYWDLVSGESLEDALENLAQLASKAMEDDCEQMEDEESMEANWGHLRFLADGEEFDAE